MLNNSLIFGIQSQIKKKKSEVESLQESTTEKENSAISKAKAIRAGVIEEAVNPGFGATIRANAEKSIRQEENKKVLMTEAFSLGKAEKKLEKDIQYFSYLFENFVHPELKSQYSTLLESILDDTIKLYQECDVTPRLMSPALNSQELTESMVIDLYKNGLNKAIKDNYTKPLLSGITTELHESTLKNLVRKVVEEGAELDMESVAVYLPFEECMYNFNRNILIPELAATRIKSFVESTDAEFRDLFEENASDILRELEKKIKLLTALVAPKTFDAVVDSDVDGSKMAGVTIVSDANFAPADELSPDGICPESIASDAEASEEMEDELEANEVHDLDDDGVEDDLDSDIVPGIETIDSDLDLSPEEVQDLDDEVAADEAADGEGLEGDDSDDDIESEGVPAEAELPGGSEETGETVDSDEPAEAEFNDEEVNSDEAPEGSDGDNDEDDQLVEEKEEEEAEETETEEESEDESEDEAEEEKEEEKEDK